MRLPSGLVLAATLAAPSLAAADVFTLRAEVHGGGSGGIGLAGDRKDDAFAAGARGPAYGALVGAEILFVDAWVEHHQIAKDDGVRTWTQFMTGLDIDVPLGTPDKAPGAKDEPKPKGYLELGLGAGFGVGTGQQVMPPLDNSEITDKGFLLEARLGAGYNLGSVVSLGVLVPVSAGYFFKSGTGAVANDVGTHYQAAEAALLLNLRVRIGLK